jgi:hypothetical protein
MSKLIVHEIVSNVDTIIFLKNVCIEFAKWGLPAPSTIEEIEEATWKFSLRKRKKKLKNAKVINPASSWFNNPVSISKVVEPGESGNDDGPSNTIEINAQEVEPVPKVTTEPIEEVGIRFRVCAGNLMSASPWFNRVLKKNGWMESSWNSENRCFYVSAEDWDEEAFIVLMNIFHLRNDKVPRTVTLEILAKIAILVDYYECGESIGLFMDVWVADLRAKTPIPTTYCRDLILWMWVSWAFRLSDLFKQTTAVAIKQCTEPVRNLGLPIPAWITGTY